MFYRNGRAAAAVGGEKMAVFDHGKALAGVDGDRELLAELVDLFCEDCPRLLDELTTAAAGGDAEGIARAAHAIRGSVGIFGAGHAGELATELENRGRAKELDGAADFAERLRKECEQLFLELGEFVGA